MVTIYSLILGPCKFITVHISVNKASKMNKVCLSAITVHTIKRYTKKEPEDQLCTPEIPLPYLTSHITSSILKHGTFKA